MVSPREIGQGRPGEIFTRESSIAIERHPEVPSILTVRMLPERGTVPPFSITTRHIRFNRCISSDRRGKL